MSSELDLLQQAKCLEGTALAEIYDCYSVRVYRYAFRLLGDACLAKDCVAETFSRFLPYKEKFAMKVLISALVIVGLLFGGSATVSAAQDDLPDQPLYQLKLMSEDAHLWFTSDPVQQIDMLMGQEQIRLQEMRMLAAEGVIPPEAVAVRAQERLRRALQIVSQLDQASQLAMLERIRSRLHTQEQQMLQLEQGTCTACIPVLRQTREILQLHLEELENGLTDPDALQNQNQNQGGGGMQNGHGAGDGGGSQTGSGGQNGKP